MEFFNFRLEQRGGAHPKKNQKKPVATPKSANWHWFFLVFFGFLEFPNWHWFFFCFFFWFFLALILARIRNLKLVFFCFFWVFFGFFFGFFGLSFGQHSKLETGFWFFFGFFCFFFGIFWFFWHLILGLECHPKKKPKNIKKNKKKPKKNQKNPKKNKKKPVATPKLVNWLGFL